MLYSTEGHKVLAAQTRRQTTNKWFIIIPTYRLTTAKHGRPVQ